MSCEISQESFDTLASYWVDSSCSLRWDSLFVLPPWLKVWWQQFGSGDELYLNSVKQGDEVIGVAPLVIRDGQASLLGSADVCDYLDFVVSPGREADFFNILLDDLIKKGVNRLDLELLRPDSMVMVYLTNLAKTRGYQVSCRREDVSLELDLPASWEEFLEILNTKQRHEVRRKLRRLSEMGEVNYHVLQDAAVVNNAMGSFFKMFVESREDKSIFLTEPIESFFRSLTDTMAEAGLLRLGILELNTLPTAMVIGFDYHDCLYLYNSGYNPQYSYLSVGLLSKVLCIKNSIEEGKQKFDFLKGNEVYKYRLGGREVPLYRCQIAIK